MSVDPSCKEEADCLRLEGESHYRTNEFEEAIQKYIQAGELYGRCGSKEWEAKMWGNVALMHMKLNQPTISLEYANRAVEMSPLHSKAYYRRAQALEGVDEYVDSVRDYVKAYELQQEEESLCSAVRVAADHELPISGISVTKLHVQYISEKLKFKDWAETLPKEVIKDQNVHLIPLFQLVFKVHISLTAVIKAIDLHQNLQETKSMISAIVSHSKYLKICGQALKAVRDMTAELVCIAMMEGRSQLVELFLDNFCFEGVPINIPHLLEESCLCYKLNWLQKLFERGANLQKCDRVPVKTVIEKQHEQKGMKLEMIKLLVENGADVTFCLPNRQTVIHEVVTCILGENGSVDTLDLVCSKFEFQNDVKVCDTEGRTPWHLALAGKRKIGIEVCKVLRKYPIDPSKKDNKGRRADYQMKDDDERVTILREREAEMKGEESKEGEVKKVKKKRRKKKSTQVDEARACENQERKVEENEVMPGVLEKSETWPKADGLQETEKQGTKIEVNEDKHGAVKALSEVGTSGVEKNQEDGSEQKGGYIVGSVESLPGLEPSRDKKYEEQNEVSRDTLDRLQESESKTIDVLVRPEGVKSMIIVKQESETTNSGEHHDTAEDNSATTSDSQHDQGGEKVSDRDHSDIGTGLNTLENKVKEDLRLYLHELHQREDEYFYLVSKDSKQTEVDHVAASNEVPPKSQQGLAQEKSLPNENSHKDTLPKQGDENDHLPEVESEEQGDGFDSSSWEIECSKKVMKILSGKKNNHIKKIFLAKMTILSQGDFVNNEKHCKPVSSIKGIELYETRLNKKDRAIWQIVPQLYQLPGEADITKRYREIIRVWDIVLDHDDIDHHVQVIEKNIHERACQVPERLKVKLMSTSPARSNVHRNRRKPRIFEPCHDSMAENQGSDVVMYSPPMNPDNYSFCIAHLYSLSNCVVKLMLEDGDIERSFPYKEWPAEHDIINLPYTKAVLLLGRSGTGKTTCCLYRMWNEYVTYWRKFSSRAEELSQPEMKIGREDGANSPQPHLVQGDAVCSPVVDSESSEDSTHPESDCPLHQIFVTKNYVLCSRLRKQFSKFSDSEEFAKHHTQKKLEGLPNDITDIHDLSYPLFLTARQFYILLDYSLKDDKYFFKRDEEGNMIERIVSTDYDHEDTLSDTLFDLDDDMDEEPVMLYPTSHKTTITRERREVTASYFNSHIWPKIKGVNDTMSPLLVWMEIKSYIKGSLKAIQSKNGHLNVKEYKKLGKKVAPHFTGNRERVYVLFKSYKAYVQNHPNECFFDECDLIHHVFKRLPKIDKLTHVVHSLYIDEVQDFTQGELWLMLCNCRDPNRFFLTGDTAQSIMSGIAFRFEDVKSLFYHRKVKVVPEVQHLTINFRAHSGILRLASSVTDLLKRYFPYSFDHDHTLQEQGLVSGPKPVLLHTCSPTDLAVALAGKKQTGTMIDFGAHQAILVRTQEAKEKLPKELKAAIVLTIFESKGLEFDDVLLYNYFTDSKLTEEWRVIVSYSNTSGLHTITEPPEVDCEKPHYLMFQEEKHKLLCSELKHLYTAITRAKARLWLYESSDDHRPATWYWKKNSLVEELMVDQIFETGDSESRSSPEDWRERGDEFMQHKLWDVATKCFEKAMCPQKVRECEALRFYHDARNSRDKAEKRQRYLAAATAFLNCDRIEHAPGLLHHAAKCLYNGKQYEDAGWLYGKMKKFDDAIKCYMHSKFEDVLAIIERQERYGEAVSVAFRFEKFRALQLASKYIGQKCVLRSDIDKSLIEYGKQQVMTHSAMGPKEKERLLTIINVISPELQVQYLEQVGAYDKAVVVLKELGKVGNAYELMLKHAMYKEAFDLAKQGNNVKKQQKVILSAAKFKLSSCPTPHTELPDLQLELESMCQSDKVAPTARGIANLLQSKVTGDISYCHKALKLFREDKYTLGASEALVLLLPNVEKDMQLVETMLSVCIEINNICLYLTEKERNTAFVSHIMEQVEQLYSVVKERDQYVFQLHQDVWNIMEPWQEGNPTELRQRAHELGRAVSDHLKLNVKLLKGNKECWNVIQNEMVRYTFHHKCTERPFANNDPLKLLNYIKAYSMGLEIICHNKECGSLEEWKRHFYNLIRYNGLTLNMKHYDVIKRFPSAVIILEDQLDKFLRAPVDVLSFDDWMEAWILSQCLNQNDSAVSRRVRPVPIHKLSVSGTHFYVSSSDIDGIQHKVPHFCQWNTFCQLLREGSKAVIAVKMLVMYIEVIARRRSLNQNIVCFTNVVTMLSICAMIYYAFHVLSLPQQATVIIPQILIDTMTHFDQKNCVKEKDFTLFQSCFDTFKIIGNNQNPLHVIHVRALRADAQKGMERVLEVFTGLYHKRFNVLDRAVKNEEHNNVVTCLTLGLTLLGNFAISSHHKPDLVVYKQRIQRSLRPLMEQTDHHLKGIFEAFQCCTSARDIFDIVAKLNEQYYRGEKRNYLFNLHTLTTQMNLMPCPLTRVPIRSVIPTGDPPLTAEKEKLTGIDSSSMVKSDETDLDRQVSNEEESDEDVRRALTDTELVEMVQQQVSIDDTLVDGDFCRVCKIKLERVGGKTVRLEHIASKDHKSKMGEYTNFTYLSQSLAQQIKKWESEIKYINLPHVSERENVLIIKVHDHIKQIESLVHNTENEGKWREGEEKLKSLESVNISISKQLQESIKTIESMQQTGPADATESDDEEKQEMWPTDIVPEKHSDEEVLSGVEDEISPRQAKRKIKREKKSTM